MEPIPGSSNILVYVNISFSITKVTSLTIIYVVLLRRRFYVMLQKISLLYLNSIKKMVGSTHGMGKSGWRDFRIDQYSMEPEENQH